ncbi:site-specific recombinase [Chitinibacteraceae bacterium HSL-7]
MQETLEQLTQSDGEDAFDALVALFGELRPRPVSDQADATTNVQALCYLLEQHAEYRQALRLAFLRLLGSSWQVPLYTETGILSNESMSSALWRRIGMRLLPPVPNPGSLKDRLSHLFPRKDDYVWLDLVPVEVWVDLGRAMHFEENDRHEELTHTRLQLLEALQVLSNRLAAIGLEPEIISNSPELKRFESPFVHQNVECYLYIERCRRAMTDKGVPDEDEAQILVLLEQCEQQLSRVRKHASKGGVSVSLTYHLIRIRQHIDRIKLLLALVDPSVAPDRRAELLVQTVVTLVRAENRRYSVRDVFAENTELLALQVTDHASRTGEHYIAETRSEWGQMFRSAAGAGVIIAVMALIKLQLSLAHLPLLLEALAFGLNYSIGFMLIHMLHFTVATKQPAMTAAKIAAALHDTTKSGKKQVQLEELTALVIKVIRTQFIAILGNVSLAMPVALGICWLWVQANDVPPIDVIKANKLLVDLSPIASLAIFHAAIAGVCLFLSGLISGYYDNKAIYNRIPERIAALPWLNKLFGNRLPRKLAGYIEHNLGALAGNFYFGMMLGTIGTFGMLLGLPVDIRHIAFSSANLAYASAALDFVLPLKLVAISALGVALIGLTNLLVSFGLALWVALRSRKLTFEAVRPLSGQVLRYFAAHPSELLIPPKQDVPQIEPPAPIENAETVREWIRQRRRRAR